MKKFVLLLFCLTTIVVVFAQKSQGDELREKGDYFGAADKYSDCMNSDPECAFRLFELYYLDQIAAPNPKKIYKVIFPLANEKRNPIAQYYMGVMYSTGFGVPQKDDQEATKWFQKSAEQGDVGAQYKMGKRCEEGIGTAKSAELAMDWYRKAANQDHIMSQWKLGVIFYNGSGVSKNWEDADYWCNKANNAYQSANQSKKDQLTKEGFNTTQLQTMLNEMKAERERERARADREKLKATYVKTDQTSITFDGNYDQKYDVRVNTDGKLSTYNAYCHDSWCKISPYERYFTVKCAPNTGGARRTIVTVEVDDVRTTVEVQQTALSTYLNINPGAAKIKCTGGTSEITVSTDGNWWFSESPYWVSTQKIDNKLKLTVNGRADSERKGSVKVTSGKHTVNVPIKQKGPFNSPKRKTMTLFSLGYVHKVLNISSAGNDKCIINETINPSIGGILFGFRYNPLFKYGFGLNTGIFGQYFSVLKNNQTITGSIPEKDINFACLVSPRSSFEINIPLHLEYRFHFTQHFQIFIEGGAGIDFVFKTPFTSNLYVGETLHDGYNLYTKPFNPTVDFGGGFQIYQIQINISSSLGLLNISKDPNIKIKQYNIIAASLTWRM